MIVSLTTEICPIVIPDTYGTNFCCEVDNDMWDDFKKLMIGKAEDKITEMLDDLGIPYTKIIMGGFHSPKYYNYHTDWIEFKLEICDNYIATIKDYIKDNENDFFIFTKQTFGSRNGYISFYPYTKEKFYESEDTDYILSMWIMYKMNKKYDIENYQNKYLDEVWEYANSNGYMEIDED